MHSSGRARYSKQDDYLQYHEDASHCRQLPVYCMMVGRALVTPTRIVRLPPETELSNRVLRQFKSHSQYFIRVSFGEENSGILHLGPNAKNKVDLIKRSILPKFQSYFQDFEELAVSLSLVSMLKSIYPKH